jgi:hypothetical protein
MLSFASIPSGQRRSPIDRAIGVHGMIAGAGSFENAYSQPGVAATKGIALHPILEIQFH